MYTLGGKLAVDRICLYEQMDKELSFIQSRLGFSEKIDLPNAKSNFQKDKSSYRALLSGVDKTRIAEMFRDEIRLFDYEY